MSISIDVSINDIIWGMSDYDKQELVNSLYDDGFVPEQMGGVHPDDLPTGQFDREVSKLIGNAWRLSNEDEATILRITNKIVQ
jgi:hypothetical protein